MLVTVTVSPAEWGRKKAESHDLFYLSHKTVETLISLAEKGRTPVEKELMLTPDVPPRFQNAPALAFLEAHYGRYTQKYGYPFAQEAFGEAGAHDPLKDGKAAEQRVSSEFPISGQNSDLAVAQPLFLHQTKNLPCGHGHFLFRILAGCHGNWKF